MSQNNTTGSVAPTPPPVPDVLIAWPRPAQWATVGLVLLAALLASLHWLRARHGSTRPTTLAQEAALTSRLDLNRATRTQLLLLPTIGESLAGQIEDYRRAHGRFQSVDELRKVPGIGEARLRTLRPWVRVETETPVALVEGDTRPLVIRAQKPEAPAPPRRTRKGEDLTSPIDVNRAPEEQLRKLPGIGPVLAGRIIAARQVAPFRSVEDLRRVRGIGVKTLEKLRPFVTVGPRASGDI
jgi:competence protein ComEA